MSYCFNFGITKAIVNLEKLKAAARLGNLPVKTRDERTKITKHQYFHKQIFLLIGFLILKLQYI